MSTETTLKTTSTLVKYNNENMGTWKNVSKKGKEFYSLQIPAKANHKNISISFILDTKFVYTDAVLNKKTTTLGNQNIYIINEWDYTLNIYNKTTKIADEKIIKGNELVKFLEKNIKGLTAKLTSGPEQTGNAPNKDDSIEADYGLEA